MNKIVCDHMSVGVIAKDPEGRILLIERKKFPFGWAPPSGHLDGFGYSVACFREFEEETGLKVVGAPKPLIPKNPVKYFKCRRGGEYHIWQIFGVDWAGELRPNPDETKSARWHSVKEIKDLAAKTANYLARYRQAELVPKSTETIWQKLDKEWEKNYSLEFVWYEFFQELKII